MSATTTNSQAIALNNIPRRPYDDYAGAVTEAISDGGTLLAALVDPASEHTARHDLLAVIGNPNRTISVFRSQIGSNFPSLTPRCPQFHLFEREIAEQHGLIADEHPWLKPVRFHQAPKRRQRCLGPRSGQPPAGGRNGVFPSQRR